MKSDSDRAQLASVRSYRVGEVILHSSARPAHLVQRAELDAPPAAATTRTPQRLAPSEPPGAPHHWGLASCRLRLAAAWRQEHTLPGGWCDCAVLPPRCRAGCAAGGCCGAAAAAAKAGEAAAAAAAAARAVKAAAVVRLPLLRRRPWRPRLRLKFLLVLPAGGLLASLAASCLRACVPAWCSASACSCHVKPVRCGCRA
jgi:hypothetical protein